MSLKRKSDAGALDKYMAPLKRIEVDDPVRSGCSWPIRLKYASPDKPDLWRMFSQGWVPARHIIFDRRELAPNPVRASYHWWIARRHFAALPYMWHWIEEIVKKKCASYFNDDGTAIMAGADAQRFRAEFEKEQV